MSLPDFLHHEINAALIALMLFLLFCGSKFVEQDMEAKLAGRRVALGTLFVTIAALWCEWWPADAEEILAVLIRAAILSGLVLGASWSVLPVLRGLGFTFVQRPWRSIWRRVDDWKNRRLQAEQRAADDRRWRHEQAERERTAPERERARIESEARARRQAEAQAAAAKRREDARMRCELTYHQYARQLGTSFSRKRFDQFLERYMNDQLPPDFVEQREQLLKEMLIESLGTAHKSVPKFTTMTELAAYFDARRHEVEQLPHDEDVKDSYRTQLNKQEDEALRRFLKP